MENTAPLVLLVLFALLVALGIAAYGAWGPEAAKPAGRKPGEAKPPAA